MMFSEYESDRGWYCPECDHSYDDDEGITVAVSAWGVQYGCPQGHMMDKVSLSDDYYALGDYLLSVADDDWAAVGDGFYLPRYEV